MVILILNRICCKLRCECCRVTIVLLDVLILSIDCLVFLLIHLREMFLLLSSFLYHIIVELGVVLFKELL